MLNECIGSFVSNRISKTSRPHLTGCLLLWILASPSIFSQEPFPTKAFDPADAQVRKGRLAVIWSDKENGNPGKTAFYFQDETGGPAYELSFSNPQYLRGLDATWNGAQVTLKGNLHEPKLKRGAADGFLVEEIRELRKYLTIPVKFADSNNEPKDLDYFQAMFGDRPGEQSHYWSTLSGGSINFEGSTALDWVTLPLPQSGYTLPDNRLDKTLVMTHALEQAKRRVDLTSFDGVNLMMNEVIGSLAFGGGWFLETGNTPKLIGATWNPPFSYNSMHIFSHEIGHSLGLPHSTSPVGEGVYDNIWDVMSSGQYSQPDPVYSYRGKHTIAYHKDKLGWIDPSQKTDLHDPGTYTFTLDNLTLSGTANQRMIVVTNCPSTRSYTLEVRGGLEGYDGALPGKAVVIHEVDPDRIEPAWVVQGEPVNSEEAQMWVVGETYENERFTMAVEAETEHGFQVRVKVKAEIGSEPVAIPDPQLKTLLLRDFDCNSDGEIDTREAASVEILSLENIHIEDLTGIEQLTNLREFYCTSSGLTSLPDLSTLTRLETLVCAFNELTALPDLSALTQLQVLNCFNNQLTELPDLSKLTNLKALYCDRNKLTRLPDLSSNVALETLGCSQNQLSALPDLTNLDKLQNLFCRINQLNALPEFSSNAQLTILDLEGNQLSEVSTLSRHTSLTYLSVAWNRLEQLPDFSPITNLKELKVSGNRLTRLPDLSSLHKLESLGCGNNLLTSSPLLSEKAPLKEFACGGNQLTALTDLSAFHQLEILICSTNQLTEPPRLSPSAPLKFVDLSHNLFDFGDCDALQRIRKTGDYTFIYSPQSNGLELDCRPRAPHVTDQDGPFKTEVMIYNPTLFDNLLGIQPYGPDGASQASLEVSAPKPGVSRLPREFLLDENVNSVATFGCQTCVLTMAFSARSPGGAEAYVHQTTDFRREFQFHRGEWDQLFDGAALVNLGPKPAVVTTMVVDANGGESAETTLVEGLPTDGKQLVLFNDLLPSGPSSLVKLTSTQPLAVTFLRISKDNRYLYENPPLPVQPEADQERWLAHVTAENGGFDTDLMVYNRAEESGTVHFQSYDRNGTPLEPVSLTVPAGAAPRYPTSEILPQGTSHVVISGSTNCLVSAGYRSQQPNSRTAVVHEGQPGTSFTFYPGKMDLDKEGLLFDGLAMVNTSTTTQALVSVEQIGFNGWTRETQSLVLQPGEKYLTLLEDLLTLEPGAMIRITATVPLAVTALRLSKDGRYLYGNAPIP